MTTQPRTNYGPVRNLAEAPGVYLTFVTGGSSMHGKEAGPEGVYITNRPLTTTTGQDGCSGYLQFTRPPHNPLPGPVRRCAQGGHMPDVHTSVIPFPRQNETAHKIARKFINEQLEGVSTCDAYHELSFQNPLHEAIRATHDDDARGMSREELHLLEKDFERQLPPKLKPAFVRLRNEYSDQAAVAEEGAFLVGLYAGRGGAR